MSNDLTEHSADSSIHLHPHQVQKTLDMSNFEIPQTHRAVIVQADGTVKTEERPVPAVGENEILVKVFAIAINPTDWKRTYIIVSEIYDR